MFDARALRPMLATTADADLPLVDAQLLYEPKYDGIRAIVEVLPAAPAAGVRFWSRNGNDKTPQFPDIVLALQQWAAALQEPVVLDGEIVAIRSDGSAGGFQQLQHRIHVSVPRYRSSKPILAPAEQPAALVLFDLLRRGDVDLQPQPLRERRAALDALLRAHPVPSSTLRVSEQVAGDGRALYARAQDEGWEGLLVKVARSPYRAGKRSPEWRKLKLQREDVFTVGGWTDPRGTRTGFGALVLGTAAPGAPLIYVGDVGTGFTGDDIATLFVQLLATASPASPFATPPKTQGKAHWVTPSMTVRVRYAEMTDDGRLRHPAYLGMAPHTQRGPHVPRPKSTATTTRRPPRKTKVAAPKLDAYTAIIEQLEALEQQKKDGRLLLPDGDTLDVTNLGKVFWPQGPRTKGDLLRYYATIAPLILPVVDNRPLVMKRLPNGVDGKAFYQHRAPEPVPDGVRIATLPDDDVPARLIGGSLKTLLYMAQIAAISMDPFFSTVDALDCPEHVAIDLDPQPGATFAQILDVARWVHDELERLHVPSFPKTSGSEGLHIFIPLAEGTHYEAGMLFCQIVATMVATKHPKVATVERAVKKRAAKTIYVDYLQNIEGKTLACAYSARASAFGGVSAPLTWAEVDESPAPHDFTMDTMPARVRQVGDLWAELRAAEGVNLRTVLDKLR